MVNAPAVAQAADGVPVDSFGAAAGAAFAFVFASWGLGQLILGLASLAVLLRYRSLVPAAFLFVVIEQLGRMANGERQYIVSDLGGHVWFFSQSVADVDSRIWGGISSECGLRIHSN